MLEELSGWKGAVTSVTAVGAPTGRAALHVEPGETAGGILETVIRSGSVGPAAPGSTWSWRSSCIGASFGVLAGSQISRWIGIVGGAILAISAVWWMPYYPVWSLTYIAIGVMVMFALAVYGDRPADGATV